MNIDFIPTLQVQRELYEKPRDMARFRWYIEQMLGDSADGDERDVQLPIGAVNPMGKAHCLDAVNALIAIDADGVAAAAALEAAVRLPDVGPAARIYVNVLDDCMGGWTNRIFSEFGLRYGSDFAIRANRTRRFYGVWCWTSEGYSIQRIRMLTFDTVYRAWHWLTRGAPHTLREMLALDHAAAGFAGDTAPILPADDLEYTRAVLAPLLDASDQPTCIAALFGDEAARSCGYPPLGLSPRAGQALAVWRAGGEFARLRQKEKEHGNDYAA
jgi:hypothetical protein